jgi:hypothetical protein
LVVALASKCGPVTSTDCPRTEGPWRLLAFLFYQCFELYLNQTKRTRCDQDARCACSSTPVVSMFKPFYKKAEKLSIPDQIQRDLKR